MAVNSSSSVDGSREEWNGTTGLYTSWGTDGRQITQRALTAAEVTQLAAQDAAYTADANRASLQAKAQAALAGNINDVTQDQAIQTQAATITAASITNLAAAATAIAKLAQAVSLLAGNDINTKKELQAVVRLVIQQLDSTAGT